MAIKSRAQLKSGRDFGDVLDSMLTKDNEVSVLTPAATVTLTREDHAGKLLLVPSTATANDSYILPVNATVGETYNLAWSGVAADADNVIFRSANADGLTFSGGVLQFDTDETGAAIQTIAYPGGDDDKLTITNEQNFNLTFTATAATTYHVTGYAASTDTATAFGDQ